MIIENKNIKAEIFNFQEWISEVDSNKLKTTFESMLGDCEFTILNFMEYNFPNGAYTCIWLLAESHLAIHSFIEDKKTYIELSGCNKDKTDKFITIFNENYGTEL
ncbi:MAG: S-adenosylmethionine decarboxylase [Flavobacteriaceae bacterium]|nr:S-adenosylmethionine decarboxylase [Flavobacteriaceae bacterium]